LDAGASSLGLRRRASQPGGQAAKMSWRGGDFQTKLSLDREMRGLLRSLCSLAATCVGWSRVLVRSDMYWLVTHNSPTHRKAGQRLFLRLGGTSRGGDGWVYPIDEAGFQSVVLERQSLRHPGPKPPLPARNTRFTSYGKEGPSFTFSKR
jgi:hypothetical protein